MTHNAQPGPVSDGEFAALIEALGPFEPGPRVAVAVSGGADSLALALLMQDWAAAQGGAVTALTVDHGLRAGSGAEARRVGQLLAPFGVDHRILVWEGPVPPANLQAEARAARYQLLCGWCEDSSVLHLALGHHLEDQAETLLLRLGRGSGLEGLSGMAARLALPQATLIRPLLTLPRSRLIATLRARGAEWIEDPSNQDTGHARVRMRRLMPKLAQEGLSAQRLAAAAGHLGRARLAVEDAVAGLLARAATVDPSGFLRLDLKLLATAPEEVGLRALAHSVMTVGGRAFTPRLAPLRRLYHRIVVGRAGDSTLSGCRVIRKSGKLLIVRETKATETLQVGPGSRVTWDGRFRIKVDGGSPRKAYRIAALGREGWAAAARREPSIRRSAIPGPARYGLPALFDDADVLAIPHLGFQRFDSTVPRLVECTFAPRATLTSSGFTGA